MDNMHKIRTYLTRINPRPLLFFDVSVCDHCNLNCKGCGSFAPLATKENFLNLEDYKKDAIRLSELSGGIVHHINILGGEPLLHPDLLEFIKITRELFPVGNIYLVTNGVLIPKMEKNFWEVLRSCNVILAPTKYPIKIDWITIEETAQKEHVKFEYFGDATAENSWIHTVLEEKGNRNEMHSFLECGNANNCTVLRDGKIYPCVRAAKIELYNKYFEKDFKIVENDYIDIYSDISVDDIMKFLAKPIPFCRYCNRFANSFVEWDVSKKQEGEWT